jgi:hypothetical protein
MMHSEMRGGWSGVHPAWRGLRIAGLVVLGVVGAAVFALVFGWFVMLLWNWLMPAIFHLGEITYWQAFGLVILAKLIFGSIGGGAGRHWRRGRNRWGPGGGRGQECGEDWGGTENWRYWRDFWKEEGKDAFDRFVQRKKAGSQSPPQ